MTIGDLGSLEAARASAREAFRRLASGIAVLTTDGPAGRAGLTVSSLCSLSLEPPSVLACVHGNSRALPVILANGLYAANVLGQDQAAVAEAFAGLDGTAERFASATWRETAEGPPLLEGASASFTCRVAASFTFGTHLILAGEIIAVESGTADPLVYADRAYRRLAAA